MAGSEIPLHRRIYDIRSFRVDDGRLRIRGQVVDTKPAGMYVKDDLEPLDVHDMVVELFVSWPDFVIEEVDVSFDTHPHRECPGIASAYQGLVGLSIARGFSRKVTELFSGKAGCTHVGALLKAMAPVAVQSIYSMNFTNPDYDGRGFPQRSEEEERRSHSFVINSCHVWDEDGEHLASINAGGNVEAPVWIENRLTKLDRLDEIKHWQR